MTPSEAFAWAVDVVIAHEGGPVDHPADPGGATKYGISIRFAGSIRLDLDGDGRTTRADITALTRDKAATIYRLHFWERWLCHHMPPALALCVFDGLVNQGPAVARLLQRVAGATPDGIIGSKTVAAVDGINDLEAAITRFMAKRGKRYATTGNFETFGEGWMKRLLAVHAEAMRFL